MRPVHVAVPLAALAAVLTRWPDLAWGLAATVLGAAWVYAALRAEADARLHLAGPASALALTALPVAAEPVLPLPGLAVGAAVGLALLTALPARDAGVAARFRLAAWSPTVLVAVLLLAPLALPLLGSGRLGDAADRFAPATATTLLLLVAAAVAAYVLLTRRGVEA